MQINHYPRLQIDPSICGGCSIIAGTRMRVADILEVLSQGATEAEAEILEDFLYVTTADIRASLTYTAGLFDHPIVIAAE